MDGDDTRRGLGGRDLGSRRAAAGEEVGEHHLPATKLSWERWKRCSQINFFPFTHFPGWDVMGIAPDFGNVGVCSCLNSREKGKSRVESHISKMSEY